MKQINVNYVFPLPPERLHARYDPVFEGLQRGLSTTLIGLPESHRSSYLKFILFQDPLFLREFIDSDYFKIIVLDEPIQSSLDLLKALLYKLSLLEVFSVINITKLRNAIGSNDSLLGLLVLEDILTEIKETHRLVIVYYHTDQIQSHDTDIIPTLAKIWGMHRTIPDPLIRFLFIASPLFMEQLGDMRLSHIRGMFEEHITYFPLFDTEEMVYTRERSQAILHINRLVRK